MANEPRQPRPPISDEPVSIVVPSWHSIPVQVSKGARAEPSCVGEKCPDGVAVAAVQIGGEAGEVVLMLGITMGHDSLAAIMPLPDWNLFQLPIQRAMSDAAELEKARIELLKR